MKKKPESSPPSRLTIVDIADLLDVSPATVSNALNDRPHVDPKTRLRVKEAAQRLGYVPNLNARRMRSRRPDTIAIFSSIPFAISGGRAKMGYLMEIAASAAIRALEHGIALILVPPMEEGGLKLRDLPIDGALVVAPIENDPDVAYLRQRGIPVVSLGRQSDEPDQSFIDIRSYESMQVLLAHLHEVGSRTIALMLGAQPRHHSTEAIRAYTDVARKRRMRQRVVRVEESGGEDAAELAAAALLAAHPEIDAIVAFVDVFAVGVLRAARKAGRTVPDDLKIVTRYNGILARESSPPLTALDLHLGDLAALGVELLINRIEGKAPSGETVVPMPQVVPRESSRKSDRPAMTGIGALIDQMESSDR